MSGRGCLAPKVSAEEHSSGGRVGAARPWRCRQRYIAAAAGSVLEVDEAPGEQSMCCHRWRRAPLAQAVLMPDDPLLKTELATVLSSRRTTASVLRRMPMIFCRYRSHRRAVCLQFFSIEGEDGRQLAAGALPGCARCVADESETAAEEERVWISLIKCLPPSRCCYYWPPTWRLCRGSTRTTASGSVCSSSIHGRREEDNVPHNLPPLAEPPMPPRLPSWCPIPGCLLCSRRTTIHFPRIRRCYTTGCSTT